MGGKGGDERGEEMEKRGDDWGESISIYNFVCHTNKILKVEKKSLLRFVFKLAP